MTPDYIIKRLATEFRERWGLFDPNGEIDQTIRKALVIGMDMGRYPENSKPEYKVMIMDQNGKPERYKTLYDASQATGLSHEDLTDALLGFKYRIGGFLVEGL